MNDGNLVRRDARCAGSVLGVGLHVLLLILVLGQVVYLASRYRVRNDLTSDDLYTLTDSTRRILGNIEKRLVIEAYLSPKQDLPAQMRETRTVLENFLDELVQLGRGHVVVQRFNPLDDKVIQDKCTRIGVKPIDLRTGSATSLAVNRHWQGLRIVYDGSKQKVLEQVAPQSAFMAEALLTPAIKEVLTLQKKKIAYMEWPLEAGAAPGQPAQGLGWNMLRTHEGIAKRYEFQNVKDAEGALLPDDLDTLFLYRPNDVSDRQKYVVDQFLMKGGTLVVFADGGNYQIGQRRQFTKVGGALDAAGSAHKLTEQFLHYGLDWRPRVVADMQQQAHSPRDPFQGPFEYYALTGRGMMGMAPVAYPYFFHAVAGDWRNVADQLASQNGTRDAELAEQYRKRFRPGIDSEEFLFQAFQKIGRGPGFYWPTWVDIRRKGTEPDLPEGIAGKVMLWSSPLTLVEDPPPSLDPVGFGDAKAQNAQMQQFLGKLVERLKSEPRQQAPLMAVASGAFTSYFAGKERPKKASELKAEEEAKKKAEEDAKKAQEAKEGEQPADPLQEPGKDKAAVDLPVATADEKPKEPVQGPPKPPDSDAGADAQAKPAEPAAIAKAEKPGRIVMIGDSDFIRDDLVRGDYRQLGGPVSQNGGGFFMLLLDWLSQDRDLADLQSRVPEDRKLTFLEQNPTAQEDPRDFDKRLRSELAFVRNFNFIVPCVILVAVGLLVWLYRRNQKRAFLAAIEG
jgi:ABC-type uncharacterized transport system involved in gliding motility auxiliary subunit